MRGSQHRSWPSYRPPCPRSWAGRANSTSYESCSPPKDVPGTPQIVSIDGAPGVGKTAFALQLAHKIAHNYQDGQFYADLRVYSLEGVPRTSAEVLEDFLTTLGVKNTDIPVSVESRSALYRSILSDRRMLVVLDNVVDARQVTPLLPASSLCGVIITSRTALSGLAIRQGQRVTLRPLSEASSIWD
jgi:predicted ATPase